MPIVINKNGRICANPGQYPAPILPFEFLLEPENRFRFLEALFYERERYGIVVRLEFTPKGMKLFYRGGLIATLKDGGIGRLQDSGPLMVSRRLLTLLGVSDEMTENILFSCSSYEDYYVVVARDRRRTVGDFLRSLLGREPGWSWWHEK